MKNQKINQPLPQRKPLAEAFIVVGAIFLFLSPVALIVVWALTMALSVMAEPSLASTNHKIDLFKILLSLLPILAVSCLTQSILLLIDRHRVDHYRSRILALVATLSFPFLFIILSEIMDFLFRRFNASDSVTSSPFLFVFLLTLSIAGTIWLWVLLLQKNKLFWTPTGVVVTKHSLTQPSAQSLKTRIINNCLIFIPIGLIAMMSCFWISSIQNDGEPNFLFDAWLSNFDSIELLFFMLIIAAALITSIIFGIKRHNKNK